jgi:hypothetical protein
LASEEFSSFQVGSVSFDDDEEVLPLQALPLTGPLALKALFDDSCSDSPVAALRELVAAFARAAAQADHAA